MVVPKEIQPEPYTPDLMIRVVSFAGWRSPLRVPLYFRWIEMTLIDSDKKTNPDVYYGLIRVQRNELRLASLERRPRHGDWFLRVHKREDPENDQALRRNTY